MSLTSTTFSENIGILKKYLKNCPELFNALIEKYSNKLRVSSTFKKNNQYSKICQENEIIFKVDIVVFPNYEHIGNYEEIFKKGKIIKSFNDVPIQEYVKTIKTNSIF